MSSKLLEVFPPVLIQGHISVGLAIVFAIVTTLCIIESWISVPYPDGIPLVRERPGARRFSLRTRLMYYLDCETLYKDAYENYSKKDKAVIVPGLGLSWDVIMPSKSIKWLVSQPDSIMSASEAFVEIDQIVHSMGDAKLISDAWQALIIKQDMNRVLESICAAMNDELAHIFDDQFGTDTDNWKEIDLLPTMSTVIAAAASRFSVGLPLCRNKDYLHLALQLNQALVINAGATGSMPRLLQPLFGALFNIPTHSKVAKLKKYLVPLWRSRVEGLQDLSYEEPNDLTQMMVRYARDKRPQELMDCDLVARRMALNNFGSMHQTSVQATNLLLNVIGSDAEFNTIAALREEFDRVLLDSNVWTKTKVNQLSKADSCARETLRVHTFGNRAAFRKVMVDGLTTQEGHRLAKGTMISVLTTVHHDEDAFEDALKFDPFRFSRAREDAVARGETPPTNSLVTTGPDFLAFSHGRHACPGRFLVDFELKMILAYVLRNYDIAFPAVYGGKRPANYWLAEAVFPPDGVKIVVKRRMT